MTFIEQTLIKTNSKLTIEKGDPFWIFTISNSKGVLTVVGNDLSDGFKNLNSECKIFLSNQEEELC